MTPADLPEPVRAALEALQCRDRDHLLGPPIDCGECRACRARAGLAAWLERGEVMARGVHGGEIHDYCPPCCDRMGCQRVLVLPLDGEEAKHG